MQRAIENAWAATAAHFFNSPRAKRGTTAPRRRRETPGRTHAAAKGERRGSRTGAAHTPAPYARGRGGTYQGPISRPAPPNCAAVAAHALHFRCALRRHQKQRKRRRGLRGPFPS